MAAGDGLVSMTPTSIAHSGTSASINADGGVDFTAVTSLSLNGVFTSDYDNYLIVVRYVNTADVNVNAKYRLAGTDTTGSDYSIQYLIARSTSLLAARQTGNASVLFIPGAIQQRSGVHIHVYGPALAQPTAHRTVSARGYDNAEIADTAGTHSLSTVYDGITLEPSSGNFTGNIHVFGYEE